MRVLGFDLGQRHLGVALWEEEGVPARPQGTVPVTRATLIARMLAVIEREKPDEIVIGLPLRLDGREGLASRDARKVAIAVAVRAGLPVHLEDERLTTVQAHAHRVLAGQKGRAGIDAHAAAIVLQTFVDRRRAASWRAPEDEA